MASDRHNMLVIPPFPDLPRHEGMPEVMEMKVLYPSSPTGSMKGGLPSLRHGLAFPGKDAAPNGSNFSFALFLADLVKDCSQDGRDRNRSFLVRLGILYRQSNEAGLEVYFVLGQPLDFSGSHPGFIGTKHKTPQMRRRRLKKPLILLL